MTDNVLITDFDDYQAEAMRTAAFADTTRDTLATAALGLTGEAGEAAEIVKKWFAHGHELDHVALRKELGDVLWYIALACAATGIHMSEIASANIAKLRARYPEGFSTTESQKRCVCGHHQDDHDVNSSLWGYEVCTQCDECPSTGYEQAA